MDKSQFPKDRGSPPSPIGGQQARFLKKIDTPALHHKNADGSTSKKVFGRLYVQPGEKPKEELITEVSRLVWMPEGIVLTPRTAANPLGWGLPPTPDGKGTIGGDFPYVVINQYQHNNTPEYLHSVYSDRPDWYGDEITLRLNWPIHYINFAASEPRDLLGEPVKDDAGAIQGGVYLPQFVARYVPLLAEKRQTQWFCHRPKTKPWPFKQYEEAAVFTNLIRMANNMPDLSPQLEGWTPDFAQAICLANVQFKKMTHEDVALTAGWQTADMRVLYRAGFDAKYGENLFANRGKDSDRGFDAVEWWKNSPPHHAAQIRDYTNGARATYTANGTAQLMAEVQMFGHWLRTKMDTSLGGGKADDFASEFGQSFYSVEPKPALTKTTDSPLFGRMSIARQAAQIKMLPTRNIPINTYGTASYKQSYIICNKNDSPSTFRQTLVGCAFHVTNGVRRYTDEQFNALLLRKAGRERRYNADRVVGGLPVDAACVGSEAGLTPAMTGWDVHMLALSYEESGTPWAAPSTASTSCALVLHKGKPEDFLTTKQEIGRLPLGFNPVTIGAVAQFSEDGTKCAYAVGEFIDHVEGGFSIAHGERLHFYEFHADGSHNALATSEVEVVVTGAVGVGRYTQAVDTRCKLYPYYSGNTLKWVDMALDCSAWLDDVGGTSVGKRDMYASLIIDDGLEWAYCDTHSGGASGSNNGAVGGFVRQVLSFDPNKPEAAHWIEYSFTAGSDTTTATAAIYRNMATPELVKTIYASKSIDTPLQDEIFLVPLYTNKNDASPAGSVQIIHPSLPWGGGMPATSFKASFSLGSTGIGTPSGNNYAYGGAGRPKATNFAPVSYSLSVGHKDSIAEAALRDAYVIGGYLRTMPFGVGLAGIPVGDGLHFKSSNLDLEAITGIAGLSDDILPLWSM